MIASLACVLVSRLMFNLREPRRHTVSRATITKTTAASYASTSTTILLHTLTKVEDVDEPMVYESWGHHGGLFYDPIICEHY